VSLETSPGLQPPRAIPRRRITSPPCMPPSWAKPGHHQWISWLWGWEGKPWPWSSGDGTNLAAAHSISPAHLPAGRCAPPGPSGQAGAQFPAVGWWDPTASGRMGVYCLSERGKSLRQASTPGSCHASSPCRHWRSVLRRKA